MNEQAIINKLLGEGYDKAYVWDAKPGESNSSHKHQFDTQLAILAGNISIEIDGQTTILET